ncbi:hypothetical protein ACFSUS_21160 [Spirosoma soli]|uniref:Outer membrane protein beta-barrel domain-containing protein n=1 Tax=Spirosoma soli TaxID=1770529 RepID=A0ABW5M8A1_9BACT
MIIRVSILIGVLILVVAVALQAQSTPAVDSLPDKRSVWRLGGGTGLLVPLGLPNTIFRQAGINLQVGVTQEYYWRRRVSLLVGGEYRLQSLVADARFVPTVSANGIHKRITAQPAPDSIKYSLLRFEMISIPVMVRYYFARNATKRLFVDVGASFNFPVAVTSRYRTNGLTRRDNLISSVRQPVVLLELAAGANGQVFSGRLTKANNLLGALLFGGFLGIDSSVRTPRNKTIATAGFLTRFVF